MGKIPEQTLHIYKYKKMLDYTTIQGNEIKSPFAIHQVTRN